MIRSVLKRRCRNMRQNKPDIDDLIFAEEETRVSDR